MVTQRIIPKKLETDRFNEAFVKVNIVYLKNECFHTVVTKENQLENAVPDIIEHYLITNMMGQMRMCLINYILILIT